MPRIRITKSALEKLPFPERGQIYYRDTDLRPFGVCVGKTAKTYFVQRNLHGRTRRISLGRYGEITLHEARTMAFDVLRELSNGTDPSATSSNRSAEFLTLRDAFADYVRIRRNLSERSRYDYESNLRRNLGDWLDLPLASITSSMCLERHALIGVTKGTSGANTTMRVLRAIYNCTAATYDEMPPNPVLKLSQTRAWYRERRRRTVIRLHELPRWYAAVMELENETMRDYLRLLLFTGLRRSEGLNLRWSDVDFGNRILTIPDTKNHEPLTLPLSDFLFALLNNRRTADPNGEWVFASHRTDKHFQDPKKAVKRVIESSGVTFMLHDLRRTFITVAESLDIPAYALKALLNHKDRSDVTAGYIILDAERLRRPMQAISDFLIRATKPTDT
jgi:integrase